MINPAQGIPEVAPLKMKSRPKAAKSLKRLVADAGIEPNLLMFKIQETAALSRFAKFYE